MWYGCIHIVRQLMSTFHDARCFDTTYLMNHHYMPYASFVGKNHHRQSIPLGCALISHKDIVSYKLIFGTWFEAIGNIHPSAMDTIIIDQFLSIKPAIAEVMSHTVLDIVLGTYS